MLLIFDVLKFFFTHIVAEDSIMNKSKILDLVGIGFGPAGISLAAAVHEHSEKTGVELANRVAFFERATTAGWQTGLLFRNADIQHHYLRDLATPRDPRSRFTFANFLKEKNRIFEFGSLVYGGGGGAVSRIEWSEYVAWAADLLSQYVTYDCAVKGIEMGSANGEDLVIVHTAQGEVLTRAVVFCAGQEPDYPQPFVEHLGPRVFHATQFLNNMTKIPNDRNIRFCIVGAGQAAIEIINYLHATYPSAQITGVQRSLGFHHGNHSPFIQRMFHPKESDQFYALDPDARRAVLNEAARANYAAVDREAVSALYRTLYEDRLLQTERVRFLTATQVIGVEHKADGVYSLETQSRLTDETNTVDADIVVLATGFIDHSLPSLLEPLRNSILTDKFDQPVVNYDFSLVGISERFPPIFVSGDAEPSHGLGASNSFSMIAIKAERVVKALDDRGILAQPSIPRMGVA
ncbi:MAG: hypothetical protein BGP07_02030 [Rhizobiales bacterium 63-22]|nr:MAG: hypothetical protein BGP07_02030 [Rhizobiales bacterium 63-22]